MLRRLMLVLCALSASWPISAFGADAIKIGLTIPLSGAAATNGIAIQNGARLAVEEINKAGGVNGSPVVLIEKDTQGRPDFASNDFQDLVQRDGVQAIVSSNGGTVAAQAAVAARERVPLLAITSSSTLSPQGYVFAFGVGQMAPKSPTITLNSATAPTTSAFVSAYRQRFGSMPTYEAALAYDMIHLYAKQISTSGYDGQAIAKGILRAGSFQSVLGGKTRIDRSNLMQHPIVNDCDILLCNAPSPTPTPKL